MQTSRMKLSQLRPPERNVRFHPDEQVAELARAVTMFGQTRPIVIDEDNTVLAGNGLVMALKKLGRKDGDVYRMVGLSQADKAKLMLSDNRVWQLGLNDQDAIIDLIKSLDGDIDIPGFDPVSLDFGPAIVPGMEVEMPDPSPPNGADDHALTCPHCQHQFARA